MDYQILTIVLELLKAKFHYKLIGSILLVADGNLELGSRHAVPPMLERHHANTQGRGFREKIKVLMAKHVCLRALIMFVGEAIPTGHLKYQEILKHDKPLINTALKVEMLGSVSVGFAFTLKYVTINPAKAITQCP